MRSSTSLRSFDAGRSEKEKGLPLMFSLDRNQNIVSISDNNPFDRQGQTVQIGKSLEQIGALRHFHALLAKGFCFKSLPVPIEERWYMAEFVQGGSEDNLSGGELIMTALGRCSEAAVVLHDFVQAIDPFSLDRDVER